MKKYISGILLLFTVSVFSQGIVVDTTTYTIPNLVRNVLMQNSCSNETNFQFSSRRSIGSFTSTNPNFPIQQGVIIRNGIAKYSQGTYTGTNLSSQINTNGDADLQNISNSSGQTTGITDVAYLQFDFTPVSTNFSFDFLFASNEYGEYQCGFSDVFAFLLTNLTTGQTTNLAVIPNTTTPVSVKNIRNTQFNTSCLSQNPSFFSRYNVTSPTTSAINMRGETVLMTAYSEVIPNQNYRIKIAIGDYNDSGFDSAVFIAGGNFSTSATLGPDITICEGQSVVLNPNLGAGFTYTWMLNGEIIPNATGSTYTATQPGTYSFNAVFPNSTCSISDEVVLSNLQFIAPVSLYVCNTGQAMYPFNLTTNSTTALGLDSEIYSILYFASLEAANANTPSIPTNQLASYLSAGNQTIYCKIRTISTGLICSTLLPFELVVSPEIIANTPNDVLICTAGSGNVIRNLNTYVPIVLNGQNPENYVVSFFNSEANAMANQNPIQNTTGFGMSITQSPYTLWVRMQDVSNALCFDVINFKIRIEFRPPVDTRDQVVVCSSYELPPLTHGNYFTETGGNGTQLNAGDIIEDTSVIYIYSGPTDENPCDNESFFAVIIIEDVEIEEVGCGVFIVPGLPAGEFYTQPNAGGDLLAAGTQLSTDQTIYYHAVIDDVFCTEKEVNVVVYPLPPVDALPDVVTCDTYVLPIPVNGTNYFDPATGNTYLPGQTITESMTLILTNIGEFCASQHLFSVDIIYSPDYNGVISACGSYTLPELSIGNYFTQPAGGGSQIPSGTVITSSQTIYFYVPTTTSPNCTDNLSVEIVINTLPTINTPSNVVSCGNYSLPPLPIGGTYYQLPNGEGFPLQPGHMITNTQTVYIYAAVGDCINQHSFLVQVNPPPPVDSFTDVFICEATFVLPPLTNGSYYTANGGPNGGGQNLQPGTVLTNSQIIYIYNPLSYMPSCYSESLFSVSLNNLQLGNLPNINACDSYVLPPLNLGNYFTEPNGSGTQLPPGTVINTNQTIYVYAQVGDRLNCSAETSFTVTISSTPVLDSFANVQKCGSYILPALTQGNYFSGPNGTGSLIPSGSAITSSQTIYVFATAPNNTACFDQKSFTITINPLSDIQIPDGVICVDFENGNLISPHLFQTGLNTTNYTVSWYLNQTLMGVGNSYLATQEGVYDVIITNNFPDNGTNCGYNNTTAVVTKSSKATGFLTVIDDFFDSISIYVTVTGGFGDYVFQLDNNPIQQSPDFHNVDSGQHTIKIIDTKGDCGTTELIANVLKYPKFFTPNDDGYNDYWNISDLSNQTEATIFIYDRYGKLLKQISPSGLGWDGRYNNNQMPATDYWFEVQYLKNQKPTVFKSHFSIKR